MIVGIAVTTVGIGMYTAMRGIFHMGGTKLSGVLGGTQTQPAVLGFVGRTGHDSRVALGYAPVLPGRDDHEDIAGTDTRRALKLHINDKGGQRAALFNSKLDRG